MQLPVAEGETKHVAEGEAHSLHLPRHSAAVSVHASAETACVKVTTTSTMTTTTTSTTTSTATATATTAQGTRISAPSQRVFEQASLVAKYAGNAQGIHGSQRMAGGEPKAGWARKMLPTQKARMEGGWERRRGRETRGAGEGLRQRGADLRRLAEEERGGVEVDEAEMLARHPRSFYIIPPDIARPLVFSSQLLLLQAFAALVVCWRGVPGVALALPPLLFGTYLTSVNFWRCPSISNRWRYADYALVTSSVLYGSLVTFLCTPAGFHAVWCRGWGVIAAVFVLNEAKFWLNRSKARRDYVRAVWVHLGAVHVGGNVLVSLALCALTGTGPW